MDENTSNTYDVSYSTPVSLQELSVIAVGLELWRSEINEYRKSQTLKKFRASDNIASLRTRLPELPSVIYDVIVKYVTRLGNSIADWLHVHSVAVYYIRDDYRYSFLEYFDDFVGDHNGSIDFVKTAERMMHCDSLDDVLKFIVACRYFLEDHVIRIWPSVREKMDLGSIDFYRNAMLYYWMCRLDNRLIKILPMHRYDTIDEVMLIECVRTSHNPLAINYFWNRVPYERRMRIVIDRFPYSLIARVECFARSILPRLDLNDQQVIEFVENKGQFLMEELLDRRFQDERLVVQTWMRIRNRMNGIAFSMLIAGMLRLRTEFRMRYLFVGHLEVEHWLHMCCIIWDSAPYHLKRSAIIYISSDLESNVRPKNDDSIHAASAELLLYILPYFTPEEKQSFWRNCWKNLILNKNARDLQRIMEMCLAREDDMIKFKENVIADGENLQFRCVTLLSGANFDEIDALANFYYPRSAESAKHLKQRTLQWSLISDDLHLDYKLVVHGEEFDSFINEAYDSVDLANDFKHQLVSSPNNLKAMFNCVIMIQCSYEALRKFIETFVSTEQILQQTKSFIIDRLKEYAHRRSYVIEEANSKPLFDQFLLWCLGSNELVVEFQRTYITPCLEARRHL